MYLHVFQVYFIGYAYLSVFWCIYNVSLSCSCRALNTCMFMYSVCIPASLWNTPEIHARYTGYTLRMHLIDPLNHPPTMKAMSKGDMAGKDQWNNHSITDIVGHLPVPHDGRLYEICASTARSEKDTYVCDMYPVRIPCVSCAYPDVARIPSVFRLYLFVSCVSPCNDIVFHTSCGR